MWAPAEPSGYRRTGTGSTSTPGKSSGCSLMKYATRLGTSVATGTGLKT